MNVARSVLTSAAVPFALLCAIKNGTYICVYKHD